MFYVLVKLHENEEMFDVILIIKNEFHFYMVGWEHETQKTYPF